MTRVASAWRCPSGHHFDVARQGYVNLLQPQDRRAASAGDQRAVVDARARLVAAGVGRAVAAAVLETMAARLRPSHGRPRLVELGCGCGDLLAAAAGQGEADAIGLDLSTAACAHAARRFPWCTWVVANADRRLPVIDRWADVVLSLHARRNPVETSRVLGAGGLAIVGVPAADDLIELRAQAQGDGTWRSRVDAVVDEHAEGFELVERRTVRERHWLTASQLNDLLEITYRGGRRSVQARMAGIAGLHVTSATDLLVLEPRQGDTGR